MKKNATTANMRNLILAFAPNITADSMKNWLKWMMSVMTGANHPIKQFSNNFCFQHQPMRSTKIKAKFMAYSTSKPFSIMLFLRISMAFIVSGPETLLIIRLFSLNLPMK